MTRFIDWPERLHDLIEARRRTPFAWGTHDCCTFAADAVQAMTGEDPLADLRGRWRTRTGARRKLAAVGGLEAGCDERLGGRIPALSAQRGDIALFETEDGPAIGMVWLGYVIAPGPGGLAQVPVGAALASWRII